MVLHGVAHHRDLLFGEPAAQLGVGREDASGVDVMSFAAVHETCVVIGGDGVNHAGVGVVMCGQFKALRDDRPDVVRAVRGVEMFVAGNDLPFDVLFEFRVHGCKVRKKSLLVKGGIWGGLSANRMAYPGHIVYFAYETARVSRMTVIFT